MASTAWTAPRADLVAELAKTRTERDLVTARLQLTLAKEAERRAYDRDRMRRRRSQANHLVTAAAVADGDRYPARPTRRPARRRPTRRTQGEAMKKPTPVAVAAGAAFLACIVAANYVTTKYGFVPMGFGLMATAGTYFAGATFVLRDLIEDTAGKRWVAALIVAGAALSFAVSAPFIAIASAVAFGLSELCDFGIYQPLRRRGYIRAAVASNIVGSFVDTVVFVRSPGSPCGRRSPGRWSASSPLPRLRSPGW